MSKQLGVVECFEFPLAWEADPDSPPWDTPLKTECCQPKPLRDFGIDRIVNRKVTWASCHLGTYGMGGAGLFGLELATKDDYPEEVLVLCLWGAASWLLLNGTIIDNNFDDRFKPLGYQIAEDQIIGTTLTAAEVNDDCCRLEFNDGEHVLTIDKDPHSRPQYGRNKQRMLECSLWDAWRISTTTRILV